MKEQRPRLFEGLAVEQLALVLDRLERRRFPSGVTVLAQGEYTGEMYLIEDGAADIYLADPHMGESYLTRVGPGETLGEMSLLTGYPISATARASKDSALEVLVLTEDHLFQLGVLFPQIYRNLAAILSERLSRTNRRTLHHHQENLTFLLDDNAPPLLGYALACSLAWHTRSPILLLLVADPFTIAEGLNGLERLPAELPLSAGESRGFKSGLPMEARAYLMVVAPSAVSKPSTLIETLETLCSQFAHVLVQVVGQLLPSVLAARSLKLTGLHGRTLSEETPLHPQYTLRAWSGSSKSSRPDPDGIWHIPALGPQDERTLQQGILSIVTPAGRALGWIARDLARLKVGLALGAGAAKGYAHIGVLRVLERIGLPIDYLAGTSIGAVVAALYAGSHPTDEIAEILDKVGATAFRLTLPRRSLLSSGGLRAGIQQIGGQKHFEELDIPVALVAADLITQQEVVFRRGLVWPAVLASLSIPGIYPPQRIGPYTLVDGGVLNPVPADVAAEMGADRVIGVKLSSRPGSSRKWAEAEHIVSEGPSVVQTLLRSLDLMQSKITASTAAATTILIEPDLKDSGGAGLRHFSQGRRFIEQGEATAEAALPRLAATFPWLNRQGANAS